MVLLVTILFTISTVSAIDTNDTSTSDTLASEIIQSTESNANIESNSIKNMVSNEDNTITNVSSSNDKVFKKTTNTTETTKTATDKQNVIITTNPITSYANQLISINANVTYQNGENLSSAKTAIKINGKTIGQTRVTNGTLNLDYVLPKWHAKEYNITIIVGETSNTSTTIINSSLIIQRHNVEITIGDFNCSSAEKAQLKAIVKYENGTYVNATKAVFKINGKTIGSTIITDGIASIESIVPTKAKTYKLVLKVGETTISNYNETYVNLKVNKRTPTVSTDELYFASEGNAVTLTAKLTNVGYANASGKIGFKINDKTVAIVQMVNSTATYTYDVSKLKEGVHVVTFVYGGSNALYEVRKNVTLRVQSDSVSTYTYEQILEKANKTHDFILNNSRLPNFVTINEDQVSIADYLYLLTQLVTYNNSFHNGGFSTPSTNTTTSKYNVEINEEEYLDLAKVIVECYIKNGRAPKTITTSSGVTLSFNDTVYSFTKVVSFLYTNGRLPNYLTVTKITSTSSSSSSSSSSTNKTIISTANSTYVSTNKVPSGYGSYLVSANNAYVNSTIIKNAVQAATKDVNGTYNQAVAIFDYVNNYTDYSSYFNTRYGAIETLKRGYGNCVDQSHLLIGMFRTALIPARYCHATCYFRSGLVVGHVWVEVYVNGKWYQCDTTSNQNTFGNIVNWYSSSTVKRYTSLSF